mmetsp:Transcript_46452/g.104709  ORF Transcript_46452/g.104709 Transcript_46452/m.104709 type:complete len:145 (+) Transcript_46452:178-612(+)
MGLFDLRHGGGASPPNPNLVHSGKEPLVSPCTHTSSQVHHSQAACGPDMQGDSRGSAYAPESGRAPVPAGEAYDNASSPHELVHQQVPRGGLTAWTGTPWQLRLFCALLHVHGLAPCQPDRIKFDLPSAEVHEYMPLSFVETIS